MGSDFLSLVAIWDKELWTETGTGRAMEKEKEGKRGGHKFCSSGVIIFDPVTEEKYSI